MKKIIELANRIGINNLWVQAGADIPTSMNKDLRKLAGLLRDVPERDIPQELRFLKENK